MLGNNIAAPIITSAAAASFAENGTGTAYTVTGTDADAGTTLSYALGGTDAAKFAINASTGAVTFVTAPNFEAPTDAGGDKLDRDHERKGEDDRPQLVEAELGARLGIGRDSGRIIICGTGNNARAEQP